MWQVHIHGLPVGTNLSHYVRRAIQGRGIFGFWVDTNQRIGEAEIGLID